MRNFYKKIKYITFVCFNTALYFNDGVWLLIACNPNVETQGVIFLISILYPLIFALIFVLFRNYINTSVLIKLYAHISFLIFILLSIEILVMIINKNVYYFKICDVLSFEDFNIALDFYINDNSMIMSYVVVTVSHIVCMFSIWYLKGDSNLPKFLSLINFFTFFMLILICSNNLIILFVGWEGIGLFSYFLINYWNSRTSANRSAFKAILANKIGDCFFYAFIFLYSFAYNTFNIVEVVAMSSVAKHEHIYNNFSYNSILVILIVVASMAKSAQIILHIWLPDAMEGPTPVSALLHAATIVTAGIFMLLKLNHLFVYNEDIYIIVMWVGLITNLVASSIAVFQNDIKKIIAYSTASQIGIIFIAFGLQKANLSFFHIINHAFFKSFLFIMAGIVIHYYFNNQDLRNFGTNFYNRYFVYICFILCSFSLISVPFFSGFYSKEMIIQSAYLDSEIIGKAAFYLLNMSAYTTTFYTIKILYHLFLSEKSAIIYKDKLEVVTERKFSAKLLTIIIFISVFFNVLIGYFGNSMHNFWFVYLSQSYFNVGSMNQKEGSFEIFELSTLILFCFIISGVCSLYIIAKNSILINKKFNNFKDAALKKFYFNEIYAHVANYFLIFFNICTAVVDKVLIESFVSVMAEPIAYTEESSKLNSIRIKFSIITYFFITGISIYCTYSNIFKHSDIIIIFIAASIGSTLYNKFEEYFFFEKEQKKILISKNKNNIYLSWYWKALLIDFIRYLNFIVWYITSRFIYKSKDFIIVKKALAFFKYIKSIFKK